MIPLVAQDVRPTRVAFGRAPSLLMNPALRAERLDPFLPAAWVEAAGLAGRHKLPPQDGPRYVAAVDPSGAAPMPAHWPSSTSRGPWPGRPLCHRAPGVAGV